MIGVDPEALAEWVQRGRRIRELHPIAGTTATDAECAARSEALDAALAELGETGGDRHWWTAPTATGSAIGCWAHSAAEAVIRLSTWWGAQQGDCILDVFPDDGGRALEQRRSQRKRIERARDRGAASVEVPLFALGGPEL